MLSLLIISIALPTVFGALTGAPVDATIDTNADEVQFAVSAINGFYAKQGDNDQRTLVKIISAQTQVVSGMMYHLLLQVTSGGQDEMCKVSIWSRPWMPQDSALLVNEGPSCKPVSTAMPGTKSFMVGGQMTVDLNSDDVKNALDFAVKTMNAQENFLFFRNPVKVEKVTSQVVSGMAYHFYGVHMAATNCTKSLLDNCMVADPATADTVTCNFDIWWQAWMTPEYKLTNMQCK